MELIKKCEKLAQMIGKQTHTEQYESAKRTYFNDPEYFLKSHGKTADEMLKMWEQNIGSGIKAIVIPGKKYTKIDVCTPQQSGKYMVVNETGEIFGIKAYGVIHKGHQYGTLDTIDNYYWGGYTAQKLPEKPLMEKGQKFLMSSKATPDPRLFQYIGRDDNYFDNTCNYMVLEVLTGEISHVELEPWLNNRTITFNEGGR